jgi:predicted ATPase/class 3 adenylate cyclase
MTEQRMGVAVSLGGRLKIQHGVATATADDLGTAQAQLVFAFLVRERARAVPRHELAEVLWPGDLPSAWASALRSLVSKVRSFVARVGVSPEVLQNVGGCYQLRLDGLRVDVDDAELLVRQAEETLAARPHDAIADARAALATLEQPLLPAVDNPWLDLWRERLRDAAVRAGEALAAAALAAGDAATAVEAATDAVARAPYRESSYRLLMRAHDLAGNRAEALRAYERCRVMLAEELGVSPAPDTEALYLLLLGTEPIAVAEPPAPEPAAADDHAPAGTVTFLFSDIEGSSALWEQSPDVMSAALATHDALVRAAVEGNGGRVFKHTGDGMCAAFPTARQSLLAAVDAQKAVAASGLPHLRVRMGVHTGEAEARDDDFAGVALNRVARLCGLANGGQVLVSSSARLVVEGRLPAPVELKALGDVQLRGFAAPEVVYQLVHPDLDADFPSISVGHRQRDTVVSEDGPLLGRDDDLDVVVNAIRDSRLVTVTGPGGVGKTRLGLAAANRVGAANPARVWWVELAAIDADGLADAVANVVGDTGAGIDVLEALVTTLSIAPGVVILDNCEHVLARTGEVVQTLLNGCPDLRVLVTSRVPLGLSTEHVVVLDPLATPDDDADLAAIEASPAVAMFNHRARAASPRFELSESNASAVAEICRRLDGLPLAIELAAARVHSIPPAEIVHFLDERLRLLRRSQRDRSGRHRSLEEALRWSYELLAEDEQHAFNRLAVFAGSFSPAAAGAVVGINDTLDVLDLLDGLAERSMVVAAGNEVEARYRVLETLAEFGRRQLEAEGGDADLAALEAHRAYYLALVEEAAVGLQGPDEARWVQLLHSDLANVRTVFTRAVAAIDVDTALRLVVALFDYAFYRMRRDVGHWAAAAIALPGAEAHPLYGAAAGVAGFLAWERGATDDATRYTDIAFAGTPNWVAYDSLGTLELFRGRVSRAIGAYESAASIAAAAGNDFLQSIAISQHAFCRVLAGLDDAVEVVATAERLARATGNPTAIAQVAWATGTALFDRHPRRALEVLERALDLSRAVDNRMGYGAALTTAEELRTKLGSRPVATDLDIAIEQVEYWMAMGNAPNLWLTVRRIARDFAGLGQFAAAALAFGAEAGAASKLPMRAREGERHDAAMARAEQALGGGEYARQAERGAAMTPEELVAELRAQATALTPVEKAKPAV